jgi:hypothetical protein
MAKTSSRTGESYSRSSQQQFSVDHLELYRRGQPFDMRSRVEQGDGISPPASRVGLPSTRDSSTLCDVAAANLRPNSSICLRLVAHAKMAPGTPARKLPSCTGGSTKKAVSAQPHSAATGHLPLHHTQCSVSERPRSASAGLLSARSGFSAATVGASSCLAAVAPRRLAMASSKMRRGPTAITTSALRSRGAERGAPLDSLIPRHYSERQVLLHAIDDSPGCVIICCPQHRERNNFLNAAPSAPRV